MGDALSNSQNGWPVVGKAQCSQGPFHGVTFPNGILAGDVTTIALWQMERYAATVEPLKPFTCWGWFVKKIEGSDSISNHASGTAWDINADKHPMGTNPSANFTTAQIAACRAIVAASEGVLRWGGDYTGRKDGMHWEINTTKVKAAAFAQKIRNDMDITAANLDAIADAVVKKLYASKIGSKSYPSRTFQQHVNDLSYERGFETGDTADAKYAVVKPGSPLDKLAHWELPQSE